MKLLVDAGNTRIKFAWLGPGPAGVPCAPQALERDALDSLAQRVGQHVPESVHASNVAGPAVRVALEHACQSAWGLAVQWHDGRTGQGWLRNRYSNPASLGSDRWLGLLGLIHHLQTADPAPAAGTACLLASFGTATTIDTLVWHGLRAPAATFLGGLILPGVTLRFEIDPTLSPGLSLRVGGAQVGWTVADYFDGLEALLEDRIGRPGGATKSDAA